MKLALSACRKTASFHHRKRSGARPHERKHGSQRHGNADGIVTLRPERAHRERSRGEQTQIARMGEAPSSVARRDETQPSEEELQRSRPGEIEVNSDRQKRGGRNEIEVDQEGTESGG